MLKFEQSNDMEASLKETIIQLIEQCDNLPQLEHIQLLLASEKEPTTLVQEPNLTYGTSKMQQLKHQISLLVKEEADLDFLEDIKNEIDPHYKGDFDNLSPDDKAELLELIDEPDDKDVITHEEFLKATARWRTS